MNDWFLAKVKSFLSSKLLILLDLQRMHVYVSVVRLFVDGGSVGGGVKWAVAVKWVAAMPR